MKSTEIRRKFLEYFTNKGHTIVASSPLIPANDPTLLFTNAGMVQFKNVFLGLEKREYVRAASSQRCVRAGGKHNDLENVGYTARHHTFFEMLGNFSFGDYFKREAIQFAWEFLTKVLQLPTEKLWVTVFEEDTEAAAIWLEEIKIDPKRFARCGEKDNFWAMGESGPCGPCTEIFYDHGPEIFGGPPGSEDADGDRYVEIWNLVFMQYNRSSDGKMTPLPRPSVDTGMGLERISAVMQGVHNNYDIDIFQSIIRYAAKLAKVTDLSNTSLRVIADHIRSAAFLITDGVTSSNEGRGYVLRRIIRRALRHGHKLGLNQPFFYKLVNPLIEVMGEAYPELVKSKSLITQSLLREEMAFAATLDQGMDIFEQEIKNLRGEIIPGSIVFKLYDTYGFPMDLTADIARERNLKIDEAGFHQEMLFQRERSQAASKFAIDYDKTLNVDVTTLFTGYESTQQEAVIKTIIQADSQVEKLKEGKEGIIILEKTPFYAESGGQVGDVGTIKSATGIFSVSDTQRQGNAILHYGKCIKGVLSVDEKVEATVDRSQRIRTAYNHSATHLLNAALRQLLGEHVLQKGSLVEPERLRFDFSHFEPLNYEQLRAIENLVNQQIRANLKVETKIMTPEEAMDSGAIALFGEKYGKEVRVLCMGDFSMELCGGTHVHRTGDIGFFKIISESGVAAGIRRIEAVTGQFALNYVNTLEANLAQAAASLNANVAEFNPKLNQLIKTQKQLEKELSRLKAKLASGAGTDLALQAKEIAGIKVLAVQLEDAEIKTLRETLDHLKNKLGSAVIVLATVIDHRVSLVCGVTKDLLGRFDASRILDSVTQEIDGKGGGRADMAQGGGNKPEKLADALEKVYRIIKEEA